MCYFTLENLALAQHSDQQYCIVYRLKGTMFPLPGLFIRCIFRWSTIDGICCLDDPEPFWWSWATLIGDIQIMDSKDVGNGPQWMTNVPPDIYSWSSYLYDWERLVHPQYVAVNIRGTHFSNAQLEARVLLTHCFSQQRLISSTACSQNSNQ